MARSPELAAAIGANLRDAREAAGLSQRDVVKRLGIRQAQVSQWENGKYLISVPFLLAFADLYGVSPLKLLGREPGPATEGRP